MNTQIEIIAMRVVAILTFALAAIIWMRRRESGFLVLAVAFGLDAVPPTYALITGGVLHLPTDYFLFVPTGLKLIGLALLAFRSISA